MYYIKHGHFLYRATVNEEYDIEEEVSPTDEAGDDATINDSPSTPNTFSQPPWMNIRKDTGRSLQDNKNVTGE